jgi:hypothetical protein
MTRESLLSTAMTASLALCACLALPALAQDSAAVGGNADPALVGGSGSASSYGGGRATSTGGGRSLAFYRDEALAGVDLEASANEVESLLSMVDSQLEGTRNTDSNDGDYASAIRYRDQAEALVKRSWKQLGPLTRDLYTANYDRTNPDDNSQRYRSPYGDQGQIEAEQLGGAQDAQGAMQNLRDMLLPMLKDLKQGLDNELQQRSNGL